MTPKKDILSKNDKKQIEFDHLIEYAEETFETKKNNKDLHPSTLFGKEIHSIEKELENLGQKKK